MKRSATIILLLVWPLYLNDIYLAVLGNTQIGILWTLDALFYLLIPLTTLFALRHKGYVSFKEFGLDRKPHAITILSACGLCVLFVVVNEWYFRAWLRYFMPWQLFTGYPFPTPTALRVITIIYAALSAGILEEIVYRGIVTTEIEKHCTSPILVLILSCVVFAGCHWGRGPAKFIEAFVLAIPLTVWFLKRRSLWGPVICHTLYDLIVFTEFA